MWGINEKGLKEYIWEEKRKFEELSREEVLALKNGDECYIQTSHGMCKCIYPDLNCDTHRNLYWFQQLTDLGYKYSDLKNSQKSVEMMRDWGPIFKLKQDEVGTS